MDRKYAEKVLLANAICCTHEEGITCNLCPFYDSKLAENEDNVDPCSYFDMEKELIEAIKVLTCDKI
jgi:hypothetical protein